MSLPTGRRHLSPIALLLVLAALASPPPAAAGVSPESGEFYISYADIAFGNGLSLERFYSSHSSSSGLFGSGWGSNLETRLEVLPEGAVVLRHYGYGETVYAPAEGARERAELITRMVRAARMAGEFGSEAEQDAYAARLRDDARFRDGAWTVLHRSGLLAPRTVQVGAVLEYELYGREVILRTREGFSRIDERGRTQRFDTRGRLVRQAEANGKSTWYHYGANGRISRIVDDAGNSIQLSYDTHGRVVRAVGSGGAHATYRYDDRGYLRESRDAGENVYRFDYDELFNMTRIGYSDGTFVALTYRPWEEGGGVRTYRARDGSIAEYSVEVKERLRKRVRELRRSASGETLLDEIKDSLYALQPDGTTRKAKLITTTNGTTSEIEFNPRGQHTRIRAAEGEATMAYDDQGQLIRWTTAEDRYDILWGRGGRPVSVTWRGAQGTLRYSYTWDSADRLVRASRSPGSRVEFVYGGNDALEAVTLEDGQRLVWTRDEGGRVTRLELGSTAKIFWDPDDTRVEGDPLALDRALAVVRELVEQPQVAFFDHDDALLREELMINFSSSFPRWRALAALQFKGELLMEADRWKEAAAVFESALALFNSSRRLPGHLLKSLRGDLHYNLACAWSRAGDSARALAQLEQMFGAGFEAWERLDKDKDLDPVRALPEFKASVERARLRADQSL